jgi:MFS family permease
MRRSDPENRVLKITLLLASALIVMVTGVIPPALPSMEAHFAEAANVAFWVRLVLTFPCLFVAATAPLAGHAVDTIGRKRVLAISTALFGISGVAGYLAPTLALLLISRASLGIAVGGLMTSVTTLIADYYTASARERFMGLQAAVMGFAGTAALLFGGMLADIGWRVPFLTYALAILILPLILWVLYEPLVSERCLERPAPVSDVGQCVAESICANQDADPARASRSSAPARFTLFVYVVMMVIQMAMSLIPVLLPFYLQGAMGASASQSGLALSLTSVSYALISLQYGRIASRLDHLGVLTVGVCLIGAAYLLLWSAGGWASIALALLLAGTGQGLLIPNLSVWLADETPSALRGRVLGGLTTALFLGVFISPFVGEPMSAMVGFRGVCLSVGTLLLVIGPLFWLARDQLHALTDPAPRQIEIPNTGGGEVETDIHLRGLDVGRAPKNDGGQSPSPEFPLPLCAEEWPTAP